MLYDILPPAIFILSLGGLIILVARVVVRMRKDAFSVSLRSAALSSGTAGTGSFGSGSDASNFLKPTHKSVQAIKSRAVLTKLYAARAFGALTGTARRLTRTVRGRIKRPGVFSSQETGDSKAAAIPQTPSGSSTVSRYVAKSHRVSESPVPTYSSAPRKHRVSAPGRDDTRSEVRPVAHRSWRRANGNSVTTSVIDKAAQALAEQQFERAEDLLVPYIVKHSKDTNAYMLLGQAALGREAWPEAVEIFEQVVSWKPDERGAFAGLGHAAYHAGRFTRALQALQRAHEADPADMAVLQELLAIARKMDNPALQHSIEGKIKAASQAAV